MSRATQVSHSITVAGHVFTGPIKARRCEACGEATFTSEALERFELQADMKLARSGEITGEGFRLLRKALGLRATELAELVGAAPETISRWETGKRVAERSALVILGSLIEDRLEGRTHTADRIAALSHPTKLGKRVRLSA